LFVSVLALWSEAGLVRVGEIVVDGTRMRASASRDRNRGYESIVTGILQEAERIDREEHERSGTRAAMSSPSSCIPARGVGLR
jgi:hypothetical protein